jgi:hypothetical protein
VGAVFADAECERRAIVDVAAADLADERARTSEVASGRTWNRSLLGSRSDNVFMAQRGCATTRSRVAPRS